MKELDTLKMINSTVFDTVQQLRESKALADIHKLQESNTTTEVLKLETAGVFATVGELQNTLDAIKPSISSITTVLEKYQNIFAPTVESIKAMNAAYAPIFEQIRTFDSLNIKGIIAGLQTSSAAMNTISELNLSGIANIIDALPKYDFLSDIISDDFSADTAEKLYENGNITQDDINEEFSKIVSQKQFSPKAEWDKLKKTKWFFAIHILLTLVSFVCKPVTEHMADITLDILGITEFWENSGVYDLIDSIFEEYKNSTVSKVEAKDTVSTTKEDNISK